MKHFFKRFLFVALLMVLLALFLTSCNQNKHIHEFGEWIIRQPSTCKEAGMEERYCYCLEKETRSAPLGEHTPSESANCLTPQYCSVCSVKLQSASSHQFGDWSTVKAATCSDDGWQERLCTVCGKTEKKTIYRTGHQYSDWTVVREAICTAPGLRERYCACGIKNSETITADHAGEWTVLKEPTKTGNGSRERTCENCHEKIMEILYAFGSVGLTYEKDTLKNTWIVTGIGTCTEADVVIPEMFDGIVVTAIADDAFVNCQTMLSLTIPNTVEKVGKSIVSGATNLHMLYYNANCSCSSTTFQNAPIQKVVFGGNKITWISETVEEVVLSENITFIPDHAFRGYSTIKSIVIPNSVTMIGEYAFDGCSSLASVSLPEGITKIEEYTFYGCIALTELTLPESITEIGKCAFSNCSALTEIIFPNSVTKIGEYAFYECTSLKNVSLPEKLTDIHQFVFYKCSSLTGITLPEGLKRIGSSAFSYCTALTSVVFPEGLTNIEARAFAHCSSLTSVTLPSKVTALREHTFMECDSLTSIILHNKMTYISVVPFTDSDSLTNITFLGTMWEWKAIATKPKNNEWGANIQTITCTDGTITLQ